MPEGLSSTVLAAIARLPNVSDADECAICMDSLATGGPAKEIPCGHRFHVACLQTWAAEHTTCPCCRTEVTKQACDEKLRSAARESAARRRREHEDALNREKRELEEAMRLSAAAAAAAPPPRRSDDEDLALATALSASIAQPRDAFARTHELAGARGATSCAPAAPTTVQVRVPAGSVPGTRLMVEAAGQLLEVMVPAGAAPGALLQFQFELPHPPAAAPARASGAVRRPLTPPRTRLPTHLTTSARAQRRVAVVT